jgi:hypothetical protein
MRVLSYYLAGWHIKPKGVKKPSVAPVFLDPITEQSADSIPF